MKQITTAIIEVMKAVENIEKSMNVGAGKSSYKGVSDKDVRLKVGSAMRENGLCIIPTSVTPTIKTDRWEEESTWNGKVQIKTKQSTFTTVETKYLLLHTSGESLELAGYGHGVDSQDKGAGKATTYALKNTLLATFLVPTGNIDDTDKTHSDDLPIPQKKVIQRVTSEQLEKIKELHITKGRSIPATEKAYEIKSLSELTMAQAIKFIEYLQDLPEATLQ